MLGLQGLSQVVMVGTGISVSVSSRGSAVLEGILSPAPSGTSGAATAMSNSLPSHAAFILPPLVNTADLFDDNDNRDLFAKENEGYSDVDW